MSNVFSENLSSDGVLTITVSKPQSRNAFDASMIGELTNLLDKASTKEQVRVLVLQGTSRAFCVGVDLPMMLEQESTLSNDVEKLLGDLVYKIWAFPKPTVSIVEGPALGLGAGIVAACDMAIASTKALFSFPGARIGLMPASVLPYVIKAIGERYTRYYFLTGNQISAGDAHRIGLVSHLIKPEELAVCTDQLLSDLLACGPNAQSNIKQLIKEIEGEAISYNQSQRLAKLIGEIKDGKEAQQGIQAFLDKQPPPWVPVKK